MKKIILIIILVLLGIIENTILPSYSFEGAFPSFILVFAIAFSIINTEEDAIFIGIISGLLQDLFFFEGFGINLLLNLLICFTSAKIGKKIYIKNKFLPVLLTLFLSLLKILGIAILFLLFNKSINMKIALISAIFNTITMFLGYRGILNFSKKHWKQESWRFK